MYRDYYGLTGRPFQLSPDARFFYDSRGHHRGMAYLRYGLSQREGFIVITGGIGTGKTMLAQNLFNELPHDEVVAAHLVSTQVEADDILRLINAAFGLQHEHMSKAALLRNLESFFRARQVDGKRVLIVVDEAQNLPARSIEELRMLSNYQDEQGRALVQSFLLGQSELKDTLQQADMEQVRQRIIAAHHLGPLDRDELRDYVEHRLACAGWQGRPVITDAALNAWHQATAGVPRRINTLGDRILLFGALEEIDTIDGHHVEMVATEVATEMGRPSDSVSPASPAVPASGNNTRTVEALAAEVDALKLKVRKLGRWLRLLLEAQRDLGGD